MLSALLLTALAGAAPADDLLAAGAAPELPIRAADLEAEVPLGPEAPPLPLSAAADPPAAAPAADDAFEQRIAQQLLGDDSAAGEPPEAASAGSLGLGALAVAALAAAAWYTRRRLLPELKSAGALGKAIAGRERPVRVLSRQPIGGTSALVLVEVDNGEGGTRRLLVGTGGGAPSLVADLGGDIPGFVELEAADHGRAAAAAPQERPAARPAREPAGARRADERAEVPEDTFEAPPRVVIPPPRRPAAAARAYTGTPAEQAPTPVAQRPGRRVSEAEMQRARSLVDEVLSERLQSRGGRGYRGVA